MSPTQGKFAILLACVCVLLGPASLAQQERTAPTTHVSGKAQGTAALPSNATQGAAGYKNWLDEDVRWIISDEERQAFQQLTNDRERDLFIDAFWQRRDPTPDTYENEYKDEHYRRIVFANDQFGAFVPGWGTDRGRFYIMYGPPDEIVSHATGGTYRFAPQPITNLPYEAWRYNHLEGVGDDVVLPFADICHCGDYRLIDDGRDRQQAAGDLFKPHGPIVRNTSNHAHVRFKNLEELVTHRVNVRLLGFSVRADLVKATDFTTMVPITIQVRNADLTFVNKDGAERAVVRIFGRLTNSSGRVVDTFEDEVHVDTTQEVLATVSAKSTFYEKTSWLRPATYRLAVAAQNVNGDRIGTEYRDVQVPGWGVEQLGTSSLVLADKVGPASCENRIGTGHFLVGKTYIRPMMQVAGVPAHFRRDESIHAWMQVYGLSVDEKSNRPSAVIHYEVKGATAASPVIESAESTEQMKSYGGQITVHKELAAAQFKPGMYTLRIRVDDPRARRQIDRAVNFSVE